MLNLLKSMFMAACATVAFGLITWPLPYFDRYIPVALPSWSLPLGIAVMTGGALLAFSCFGLFAAGGALSPGPTFPDPEKFISWGPYNYVRNPMAEGGLSVLAGWGFYKRSPSILLLFLTVAMIMHLFVIYVEEPKLERRFGPSYLQYKSRVNRWLPTRLR